MKNVKKFVFVALAAGIIGLMEVFGMEGQPHGSEPPEVDEDLAGEVKESEKLGGAGGKRTGADIARPDIFGLRTDSESDTHLFQGTPPDSYRYLLKLRPCPTSTGLFRGTEKIGDEVEFRPSCVVGGRSSWRVAHPDHPMFGQELDDRKLAADLQEKLGLPHDQADAIMAVLAGGHEVAVGAHEQQPEPLTPDLLTHVPSSFKDTIQSLLQTHEPFKFSPFPLLAVRKESLRSFTYSELVQFGMTLKSIDLPPMATLRPR